MPEFSVNKHRFDPYKNFKFLVLWDGRTVAGISKISPLKRTTEVVKHRHGGDPSSQRKSPGRSEFEGVTLERGVRPAPHGVGCAALHDPVLGHDRQAVADPHHQQRCEHQQHMSHRFFPQMGIAH